jgi:hypothetical protein
VLTFQELSSSLSQQCDVRHMEINSHSSTRIHSVKFNWSTGKYELAFNKFTYLINYYVYKILKRRNNLGELGAENGIMLLLHRVTADGVYCTLEHTNRDYMFQVTVALRCLVTSSNDERSSASGFMSSQTGGYLALPSCSSEVHHSVLSQSQNYLTTDGYSTSLSWYQTTIRDPPSISLSLQ